MFDLNSYNRIICEGIQSELSLICVKSNITSHIPKYPFISFTVTAIDYKSRTYSDDGKNRYKPVEVKYSFTVNSDNDNECFELCRKLHDWFESAVYLKDKNISITGISGINNRDNMLTIEYEYRKGFDCVLNVMNYLEGNVENVDKFEVERKDFHA